MASARTSFAAALVCAAVLIPASGAWAQSVDIANIVTSSRGPSTWVSGNYAHQFEVDVDRASGQKQATIARNSVQFVGGHRFELDDDVFMVGNFSYQGTYYDFDDGFGATTQLRWQDVHQMTAMMGVGGKVGDDWTIIGLFMGRSAGESGSRFSNTLTGGGALVVDYEWSDTLSTGFLIGALSQLEDSAGLLVLPTVDWRFSDGWLLHFGIVQMAYPGIGPEISYTTDEWQFGFGGSYQKRRYRLDGRSGLSSKGIGEETSFPVFARANWMATENLSIGGMAGVSLGGEIRSGTKGGNKIFKEDYDPAPFVGLQVGYQF
jgi:hypothetical protein